MRPWARSAGQQKKWTSCGGNGVATQPTSPPLSHQLCSQIERQEGEELPGVQNLDQSMDEMEEVKCASWLCGVGACPNAHVLVSSCQPTLKRLLPFASRRKKGDKAVDDAKQAALKMLGARAHSRRELKTKLLERGHELHDARAALDRLQAVGLQVRAGLPPPPAIAGPLPSASQTHTPCWRRRALT